jgi:hypothetical protein
MRTTTSSVYTACVFLAALSAAVIARMPSTEAAPVSAGDPAILNIDTLGDREPDRWQGRHNYLYDENHQPDETTVGAAPSEARGCANEVVRLKQPDGSTSVQHFKRCD